MQIDLQIVLEFVLYTFSPSIITHLVDQVGCQTSLKTQLVKAVYNISGFEASFIPPQKVTLAPQIFVTA